MALLSDREAFDKDALVAAEKDMLRRVAKHMSCDNARSIWEFDSESPAHGTGLYMGAIRAAEREHKAARDGNPKARWAGVIAALKNKRQVYWSEQDILREEGRKEGWK